MPLKESALQSQLQRAQAELELVTKKIGDQVPKKNPDWRRANSRVKQIESRLNSRNAIKNIKTEGAASEEE